MNREEIVKGLNTILKPVDCSICPLKDACDTYEEAGHDCICLMLEDEIEDKE